MSAAAQEAGDDDEPQKPDERTPSERRTDEASHASLEAVSEIEGNRLTEVLLAVLLASAPWLVEQLQKNGCALGRAEVTGPRTLWFLNGEPEPAGRYARVDLEPGERPGEAWFVIRDGHCGGGDTVERGQYGRRITVEEFRSVASLRTWTTGLTDLLLRWLIVGEPMAPTGPRSEGEGLREGKAGVDGTGTAGGL